MSGKSGTPELELERFIDRYNPEIAALARAARAKMCKLLPHAVQLVYDNYNALVIGFGPTERASEAILSIALYPRWVNLFFLHGVDLPDPKGLLAGSGTQVRSVRLHAATDLDRPEIRQLIARAVARSDKPFPKAGPSLLIIRSISAKQRPRRPSGL
jgi:hypothetical protein